MSWAFILRYCLATSLERAVKSPPGQSRICAFTGAFVSALRKKFSHVRSLPVGVGLKRLFGGEMTWHGRKIVRDVGNE